MAALTPEATGGSIAEGLDRRRRQGKPVRVGLIGAGQMGTDILVQTGQMAGIEVVAAADAVPENVFAACTIAGSEGRALREARCRGDSSLECTHGPLRRR